MVGDRNREFDLFVRDTKTAMASDQHDPSPASSRRLAIEHVRANPGMYIGDTSPRGLGYIVHRLVTNSLAEARARFGQSVRVVLHHDGSIEVEDNGRLPPEAEIGRSCTELDMSTSPFANPVVAGGRNWWDYTVANRLADRFAVEARYVGHVLRQEFRQGEPISAPVVTSEPASPGLSVTFRPDPAIFSNSRLITADNSDRLREFAFLYSGIRFNLTDLASGTHEQFENSDGVRAFVEFLDECFHPVHPDPIIVRGDREGCGSKSPCGGTGKTTKRCGLTRMEKSCPMGART
jgi:DNA gyrase subunit B